MPTSILSDSRLWDQIAPVAYGWQSLSDPDSVHSEYEEEGSNGEEEADFDDQTDANEVDKGIDPRVQALVGLRA